MERDFMGLNPKASAVVVKQEVVEDSPGLPWSSSSKVPHFMSLKFAQQENPVSNRCAPHGFGAVDSAHKRQSAEIQNTHGMNLPFSMSNPSYKTPFGIAGQNFAAAPTKQQFLGGIPVTVPLSVIPSVAVAGAGATVPWLNSNASAAPAPAQLTIFYGGTVNVFDDISLEKAQAIMFLAGNGCTPLNVVQPSHQVQAPASKPATFEGTFVNKTPNSLPGSGLSSPISVSSHPIGQSGGNPANKDDVKTSKSATISVPSMSKFDPPKIVTSLGSVGATIIMPAAIPQARKASLARFLEKRKERVMSSTPYSLSKKPSPNPNPDSNDVCFSGISNVTTSPLSVGKKT